MTPVLLTEFRVWLHVFGLQGLRLVSLDCRFGIMSASQPARPCVGSTLLGGSGDRVTSYLGLLGMITPIRIPFRVRITVLITSFLSPPTLQVAVSITKASQQHGLELL